MPDIQTATHAPIDTDGLPLDSQPFLTGSPVYTNAASGGNGQALTVTLAGVAGKTTYLSGFFVYITPSSASTALYTLTVGGLLNGPHSYPLQQIGTNTYTLPQTFSPALPASAPNTAITLSVPAVANGGTADISAWGFQA